MASKADSPTTSEGEKDAPIREPEARVIEPEESGEKAKAEAAAVVSEPNQAEAAAVVSEPNQAEAAAVVSEPNQAEAAAVVTEPNQAEAAAVVSEPNQAEAAAVVSEPNQAEEAPPESEPRLQSQQQELREAQQRWESLLENSPLAVIEWSSADYRIVRWSTEATRVFGWTADEAIGKCIDELNWIFPEDQPPVEQVMADLLSGKRPRHVSLNRNLRRDGSLIHCEWYSSALPDPSGGSSVLSFVLDVTEHKQAESALAAASLQLAEADERKNEFLAALSHELRDPLAPIKNSLYILGRTTSGVEQAQRAQAVIERQVDQLGRLVDDLLDVTRIARNKLKLQRQRLELNGLVRHTMEGLRALFDKAEVHLEFHPAPRPVFVDADWNRLAQVIGSLLQNAAKFTGRGGATLVTVHAEREEKRAVIQVVDTGVGMAPETVSRLFQSFSQVDSSWDRSKGGLGLGLALVRGLVELHQGQVTAQSAGLDQGSEFTVQLPLAMEEAAAPQAGSESATGKRRRVLIIEDNIEAADSLREVLALGEYEVEVAHNGPLGIARAHDFRPEILLCDLGLPGMDGYEVARAFKADESLKGIFLVALSGSSFPEDLQRTSEAGFDRHLAKPPSLETLQALLAGVP